MTPRSRHRIAVYSRLVGLEHPYFQGFHAALAKHDVAISDGVEIAVEWLQAQATRIDAVHLHWPEAIWRVRGLGRLGRATVALRTTRRLVALWRFLTEARRLGLTVLWTVHNLEPHEGATRWDRLGYRLVARYADVIICHSLSASDAVRQLYRPSGEIVMMPHGELAAGYPEARPRREVLSGLRLNPELPVVACLGRMREYKGLDVACDAVARLNGRVQLIVGGAPHAGFDLVPLRTLTERTQSIVLIPRTLSDQEFADVTCASDAVLLPYRNVTGSGVLLTALGFGRGVVVADLPYFREVLAGEPDAGVIVAEPDPAAWAAAIESFLSRGADVRLAAALRLAGRYSWDQCVPPVIDALRRRSPPMRPVL